MYIAVVLNINFEFLLGKASAQINSGIWILPCILDYSKWPQVSQKLEKSKKNWRGVSRTVRSIQKCNKKGTLDENFECQIFYQNFFPTSQVTSTEIWYVEKENCTKKRRSLIFWGRNISDTQCVLQEKNTPWVMFLDKYLWRTRVALNPEVELLRCVHKDCSYIKA
jgi:hypothetical protein